MKTAMDISNRKEVFQAKVLQKLYRTPSKVEKIQDPNNTSWTSEPNTKINKKVQPLTGKVTGDGGKPALAGRRLYTVLPPPDDFRATSGQETATLPELEPVHSATDPDDADVCQTNEVEVRKRKRRRKKKAASVLGEGPLPERTNVHNSERTVSSPAGGGIQGETAVTSQCTELNSTDGPERLSRNKKRKLKKKRHKEKLLALGLVPRATALEFTYKQSREEDELKEEEKREQRTAEVLDFLRTTQRIYISDNTSTADRPLLCPDTVEGLFVRLSNGTMPDIELARLHSLKVRVQRKDAEQLAAAVEEFKHSSSMAPVNAAAVCVYSLCLVSTEETSVVCALFRYWITEVLPLETGMDTKQQTA
ncbi:glutamate-rich protein 1 [Chanos chanos]|uniref:Glutamate-rich protein 1 n=1 Tax=Chanos chanos TaxID=29144 RepID=A0A6J2WJ05_CHACN|nr:glutamate-rich protein 1 [Chanos chanos]